MNTWDPIILCPLTIREAFQYLWIQVPLKTLISIALAWSIICIVVKDPGL